MTRLTEEKRTLGELPRPDAEYNRGTERKSTGPRDRKPQKKLALVLACAAGAFVVIALVAALSGGIGSPDTSFIWYEVQRGNLRITVTERGNLESQDQVKIICEVDDIHGDNIHGTPILWVVPNGASVKEGDLLVELDSASHQERLDRQILDLEEARAVQIKAKVQYDNRKTQNETLRAEAKLKVDLADLALKQFEDEDGGTFQIEQQNVELSIQEAEAERLIKQTDLEGVEQLYNLGYRSRGELDQARLNALRAERQLATAMSKRKELVEYQYRKSKMELEGALASAKRNLEQVERDNDALLEQAKAATEAADEALRKEEELFERYKEQLEKCRIISPAEGMVAYVVERSRYGVREIRVGSPVHPRQTILTIPNLKRMQVKTTVHESVLDQIRAGLPVSVRVDAFTDKMYRGTVETVAVLPDQGSWMSSDTKVYETVVTIDEEVDQLKPGMTAVVEIHVDELKDVLSVPVQAVKQIGEESWCYVESGRGVERRTVKLGRTNDKYVHIEEGLAEGERVVLNPMAILDETQDKDPSNTPTPDPEDEDPPGSPQPSQKGKLQFAAEESGKAPASKKAEPPRGRDGKRPSYDRTPE